MRGEHIRLRGVLSLAALVATVFSILPRVSASATDGTISATNRYAWGENVGWIDFGLTEGNVHVMDSALSGYAWGETVGWISLNCSNTSSCGTVDYKVTNDGEGTLGGYAWSENLGWIQFAPANGGVAIGSSGDFTGYAWGENVGWIIFNCSTTSSCTAVDYSVSTDWRPSSARPASSSSSAQAQAGGGTGGRRGSPAQMAERIAQARVTILARFEGKRQENMQVLAEETRETDEAREEQAAKEREARIAERIAKHEAAIALAKKEQEELQKKYALHREERYAKALALEEQRLAENQAALLKEQEELAQEREANRQHREERLQEQERRAYEQLLAEQEDVRREEQAAKEREARIAQRIKEHEVEIARSQKEQEEVRKKYALHREERFARVLEEEKKRAAEAEAALLAEQEALQAEQEANALRRKERLAEHEASEQEAYKTVAPTLSTDPKIIAIRRGRLFALVGDTPVIYKDVPLDEWYAPYVSYVIEENIATGYKDEAGKLKGEFGVEQSITYAEVLKMAMQASGQAFDLRGLPPPRNASVKGTWASSYVAKAEELQLTVFAPSLDVNRSATRGAVVQTILEVMGFPIPRTPASFSDVPPTHPYSQAIGLAAYSGFVSGDMGPDGQPLNRFRPDDPINRAEVAKIIALVKEVSK